MIITNLVINVTRLIAGNRTGTGYIRKTKTLLCVRVGPSFGVRFYPGSTGNFTKVADSSKQLVPFVRPVHAPTVYNPTASPTIGQSAPHTTPTPAAPVTAHKHDVQTPPVSIKVRYEDSHPTGATTPTGSSTRESSHSSPGSNTSTGPVLARNNPFTNPLGTQPKIGLGHTLGVSTTNPTPTTTTTTTTSTATAIPGRVDQFGNHFNRPDNQSGVNHDITASKVNVSPSFSSPASSPSSVPVPSSDSFPEEPCDFTPFVSQLSKPFSNITFTEELQQEVADREVRHPTVLSKISDIEAKLETNRQTQQRILALVERGLVKYRYDVRYNEYVEEYVTAAFYKYYIKSHKSTETLKIDISDNQLQHCEFHLGILKINNVKETVLLSGNQMHVSLIYTEREGKKVAWGYLTSQKSNDNFLISVDQPFSDHSFDSKPKAQYLHIVKPFIVKDTDFQPFRESDLQEKGDLYLNKSEINKVLTELFTKNTIPKLNDGPIHFYDSTGITNNEIDRVINTFDKEQMKIAEQHFNKYKQKTVEKAAEWLERMKTANLTWYPYIKKLIDDHNNNQK